MPANKVIKKSPLYPTALVSGGAGFIGSYLCEQLLNNNCRVIVVDDYRSGKPSHIQHLLSNKNFALFDVDINQGLPTEIESADYVIHLAGLEEYLYAKESVNLTSLLTNSIGTKNLLDFAKKSQAKFLLASTIDVYEGMMSQIDLVEYFGKTPTDELKFSHTEAKRYAEALVWEYFDKENLDIRVVRLPEIYGERMDLDATGNLGRFLKSLLDGKDIVIHGDGTEKEFYLYIEDCISGILKALLSPDTKGKIYSLVPDNGNTTLELAFLLKSIAQQPLEIVFEPAPKDIFRQQRVPDTYTLRDLKWQPKYSLKEGVRKTLNLLGYKPNDNSFKQAELIKQKKEEKQLSGKETLNSLDSVVSKPAPVNEPTAAAEAVPKLEKPFKIVLPKFGFKNPFPRVRSISDEAKIPSDFSLKVILPYLFVLLVSFFVVFVVFPVLNFYLNASAAVKSLDKVQELVVGLDTASAISEADEAISRFEKSEKSLKSIRWMFDLFGKNGHYTSYLGLLDSLQSFSHGVKDVATASVPLSRLWISIQPSSTEKFNLSDLSSVSVGLLSAKNNIQLAQADFKNVQPKHFPSNVASKLEKFEQILFAGSGGLDSLTLVVNNLGDILGFEKEKTYMILFQNNNEIRPTGGFIGSYALVKFKDGKINDIKIDDIYNPDGQIDVRNIAVAPPKPIGDFLVEDRLYIRNANWNPDFPKSAQTIKDLYFKVTGISPDGFVALDLNVVRDLLSVTGPVFLASYNEEISKDNFYERTQFHSSYNYEEGSQQKRQFLTILGSKLVEVLFSLDHSKMSDVATAFSQGLASRHMYIYLPGSGVAPLLTKLGWDGSLQKTTGDYLYVVNSNLGGTKANYYVKNQMDYSVTSKTRDGLLRGELKLTYVHSGVDESWPGGPYTNYLRVLTQAGSKLTGAKIVYGEGLEEDIFKNVTISSVEGYTSFETSFVLQPSSKIDLYIYYDLPVGLSILKDQRAYSLVWQKQAGTFDDSFNFTMTYPLGMSVEKATPNLKQLQDAVGVSGVLNSDLKVSLVLK